LNAVFIASPDKDTVPFKRFLAAGFNLPLFISSTKPLCIEWAFMPILPAFYSNVKNYIIMHYGFEIV